MLTVFKTEFPLDEQITHAIFFLLKKSNFFKAGIRNKWKQEKVIRRSAASSSPYFYVVVYYIRNIIESKQNPQKKKD